ncbi:MAG: hypothetical protein C4529_05130 [Deltaproteobacteria bacterium]|nr:MAG: hypothetical protein C4529_05130 [Deltaproteobacteria bacterium]
MQVTDKGVRVMVMGRPKAAVVIPLATLKEYINNAACSYKEHHIGPKEEIDNRCGSLLNRLWAFVA